jgi:hypothetical protein
MVLGELVVVVEIEIMVVVEGVAMQVFGVLAALMVLEPLIPVA